MYMDNLTDEELYKLVEESSSYRELALKLGYLKGCSGGTITAIKNRLNDKNIPTEHFGHDKKFHAPCNEEDVFCENSKVSQQTLRKWYKKSDVEYKCIICGQLPTWNNIDLTLILDHKNGKNNDNRFSNLRWVCPNCNSQLDTTGSRNPNRKVHKKIHTCKDCGREVTRTAIRCQTCNSLYREKLKRENNKQ